MEIFFKIISYIIPVKMESIESEFHKLEIYYVNGKKILNSADSNYSFGSLHRVFSKALQHFQLSYSTMDRVLILGYGGGSIVQLLKERSDFKGKITAVEIDPVVIKLAKEHFPDLLREVDLIVDDAAHFLQYSQEHFDLIISDIFIGKKVPPYFTKPEFLELAKMRLKEKGKMMQNFIFEKKEEEAEVVAHYRQVFNEVELMRTMDNNSVICAE